MIKEEDRLVIIIEVIDYDVRIVFRGVYYRIVFGIVELNRSFEGEKKE